MTDLQLYNKIAGLPVHLKDEAADFIDFLNQRTKQRTNKPNKRTAGLAKGLIAMKDNFDDPIEVFNEYM
jgi:hypothetical protein